MEKADTGVPQHDGEGTGETGKKVSDNSKIAGVIAGTVAGATVGENPPGSEGTESKVEADLEVTKDNDTETPEQKAAREEREALERAEAEKAAAERLEKIKNALGEFAIKWKEAVAKQVLDGEGANMPEFPPSTEPPITEDEIKGYYTEKNSSKNYEEARRVEMAFYKAENNEKVISQLKQLVAEMPPTDPNKKRGDKLAEAAKANARQLVEDLLDGITEGGKFTQAILSDGKKHKIRLSLGLPEGKSVREVTEFEKLMKGEGLDEAFGKTGPGFYRVGDVAGYVTHGNVIAAGDKPQINNMREALGTERYDDFDSGYLKAYLVKNGVSDPGSNQGQNYWPLDPLPEGQGKFTSDDKGYGVNFNGNPDGGTRISTGDLFAAVFTSGRIETAEGSDVLIEDGGVVDDEESSDELAYGEKDEDEDAFVVGIEEYLSMLSKDEPNALDVFLPDNNNGKEYFVHNSSDKNLIYLATDGHQLVREYMKEFGTGIDTYKQVHDDSALSADSIGSHFYNWFKSKQQLESDDDDDAQPEPTEETGDDGLKPSKISEAVQPDQTVPAAEDDDQEESVSATAAEARNAVEDILNETT